MGVCTGTFQQPNGSPVANGLYQFKLSGDAILSATACICPPVFFGNLDANGNMTATFLFNDVLLTSAGSTTCYQLTIKTNGGGQVWNECYFLTGTAANLTTYPPSGGSCGGGMGQGVPVLTLETNGIVNNNQLLLNLVNGTGITMTNGAGNTTINASTSSLLLETNGTTNTSQALLNLVGAGPIFATNTAGATTFTIGPRTCLVGYNFSGGGSAVAAAVFGSIYLPVTVTPTGWVLTADQSGTATLAIMATSYSSYPALTATIAAPVLTGAIKNENLTVTTTAIPAGSLLEFSVTSAALVQTLNVGLIVSVPYA
jgi:hypothetical protein